MHLHAMSETVDSGNPPTWDGVKKTVAVFMERFAAHACDQSFGEALEFKAADLPATADATSIETTPDDEVFAKNAKMSKKAVSQLTQAHAANSGLSFIHQSESQAHPCGLACLAWNAMKKKHKPKDNCGFS